MPRADRSAQRMGRTQHDRIAFDEGAEMRPVVLHRERGPLPVSYTHLDVYKRQDFILVAGGEQHTGRNNKIVKTMHDVWILEK